MGVSVALAIVVGLVSSFVRSLGLTIQRKSHVEEDLLPLLHRRKPIRRPLWLLGFFIYITSNIFSTIFQLDALPIVILAPLGAVSLIFNALLARIILGDTFGISAVVGTGLVTAGAILIAIFGVVQEEEHSLDEIMRLWRRGPFLAFFGILVAAVVIVLVVAHLAAWHVQRQLAPGQIKLEGEETPPGSAVPSNYASPHSPEPIAFRPSTQLASNRRWSAPLTSYTSQRGHSTADSTLKFQSDSRSPSPNTERNNVRFAKPPHNLTIELPPAEVSFAMPTDKQQQTLTLAGLAFAAAAGTLSGMSLVLAKAAVELLVISIDHYHTGRGSNEFSRPESWFLVAGLGIGAVLQLVYLNYSLTFASPALICPLAFCFFNLSSIFDGLVFYDQFGRLRPYQIALVSIGTLILLVGVWVVSLIKPSGGGVEVGTWVEDDESVCDLEPSESATFLGGTTVAEPDEEVSPHPHPQPGQPSPERSPLSPRSLYSARSPTGALSPTRRRGPRYGTLIPDWEGHQLAPTGFSIGLGAASPGFVLRSEHSPHAGGHRRHRTQSESQAGIMEIMRGSQEGPPGTRSREDSEVGPGPTRGRREREEVEDTLRRWDTEDERNRKSWWRGLFGAGQGEGRIGLGISRDDGLEGGDGD